MKAETYIKKYHNSGAKMFCAACKYPTGSPVWLIASYYALKNSGFDASEKLQKIQEDNFTKEIFNRIEKA